MPKAELSAGLASGRFKGPEGSPACSRPARRTLAGLRHSPDSVCARTSRHTGTRTRPATQQPFGYLRDSHDPALVTSVIQTARQWRDRTAGTGWGPPPQGPPGRPRRAKRPARHQPGARAAPPTCTHARTRSLAQRAIIPLNCQGLVLLALWCFVARGQSWVGFGTWRMCGIGGRLGPGSAVHILYSDTETTQTNLCLYI